MRPRVRILAVILLVLGAAAGTAAGPAPAASASPVDQRCARPVIVPDPAVPWAQRRLGADRAWVLTKGGGVLVAVVDTGVSAVSPALAGAVDPGRDVLTGGRADNDCSGHGTFVAGLLAAHPSDATGLVGVAPDVRILPIRVTDNPDEVDPAKLAAGIRAAADAGARVIAVSVSTPIDSRAVRAAVGYAVRRGALVIASAQRPTDLTVGANAATARAYPAALPDVLAVAPIGQDGMPADDVSFASGPDLAAPGSNVTSIAPRGPGSFAASGHGLAVPFVAGAAALVRSYRRRLSAAAVRKRLEATADHPSTGLLPHPLLGYGVVDPAAAVASALPEESGDPAPMVSPETIQAPLVTHADPHPGRLALTASAALAGVVALGALIAAVTTRGRRRRWRAASA